MTIEIEQLNGATAGPWLIDDMGVIYDSVYRVEYVAKTLTGADAIRLDVASAPDLLAEVIRLREQLRVAREALDDAKCAMEATSGCLTDCGVGGQIRDAIAKIDAVKEE